MTRVGFSEELVFLHFTPWVRVLVLDSNFPSRGPPLGLHLGDRKLATLALTSADTDEGGFQQYKGGILVL